MAQIALMYHDAYKQDIKESGFHEVSACIYKIRLDSFAHQISLIHEYIQKEGINIESVCLTFDDGGSSSY